MSTPKTPNQSLNRLLLSHFSTLLHLIKSLPSTPSSVARSEEEEDAEDAGGLLLMAVGESTKLLPWVMGARKHVRAYLKVGLIPVSARGSFPALSGLMGLEKRNESRE
jgi:nucleolar complex protein 2